MINQLLVKYIVFLHHLIDQLFILIFGKTLFTPSKDEPVKKEYRKLQVDKQPILKKILEN